MKVLDIQRRGQQIGRLRIGQQVSAKGGKMRPARLDTFRFTTGSRYVAESVAALYGGQVRDWDKGQFEIITTESELFVTIPPRDEIISQSYEMWNAGGCVRRCDSQNEQISGGRCLCPHAEDPTNADEVANMASQRAELAKMNPPQACKLITRISVMLPDLPGLGVWRLDTHSFYAAVEIGDQADLMLRAREHGVFLRAKLRIDQRERVAGGETKKYPVPVLEILDTFRDLVSGAIEGRSVVDQLPPAPGMKALTAGPSTAPATAAAPAAPEVTAQDIADRAKQANSLAAIKALADQAGQLGVAEDMVCTEGDTYEQLTEFLRARYREVADERAKAQSDVPVEDPPGLFDDDGRIDPANPGIEWPK